MSCRFALGPVSHVAGPAKTMLGRSQQVLKSVSSGALALLGCGDVPVSSFTSMASGVALCVFPTQVTFSMILKNILLFPNICHSLHPTTWFSQHFRHFMDANKLIKNLPSLAAF